MNSTRSYNLVSGMPDASPYLFVTGQVTPVFTVPWTLMTCLAATDPIIFYPHDNFSQAPLCISRGPILHLIYLPVIEKCPHYSHTCLELASSQFEWNINVAIILTAYGPFFLSTFFLG